MKKLFVPLLLAGFTMSDQNAAYAGLGCLEHCGSDGHIYLTCTLVLYDIVAETQYPCEFSTGSQPAPVLLCANDGYYHISWDPDASHHFDGIGVPATTCR